MGEAPGGWRQDLLDHAKAVIRDDIARGRYFGAVIKVARGGKCGRRRRLHRFCRFCARRAGKGLRLDRHGRLA